MMLEEFFYSLWIQFLTVVPGLIGAIILLVVGLALGKIVGRIVREVLVRLNVDKHLSGKEKLAFRVSDVFDLIIRWIIYFVFVQAAAEQLGIHAIIMFVGRIIAFLPGLIFAAILIIVGYILAIFLKDQIISSKTLYGDLVGKIVFFLILYVSIALALPLMGINADLINMMLLVIIASIGIGLAIALGLGLKEVVAETAKSYAHRYRGRSTRRKK